MNRVSFYLYEHKERERDYIAETNGKSKTKKNKKFDKL